MIYFSQDLKNLAQQILDIASKKNIKLICAESCTGGLLSSLITELPGAAQILEGGFVTYSNSEKTSTLGVNPKIIAQFGAVSKETAIEMAKMAFKISPSANLSVSITGLAGPTGGSEHKPVGLVYIAVNYNNQIICRKFNFSGERNEVREKTILSALSMILARIS